MANDLLELQLRAGMCMQKTTFIKHHFPLLCARESRMHNAKAENVMGAGLLL